MLHEAYCAPLSKCGHWDSSLRTGQHVWTGMEKDLFTNRPHRHFANVLITMAPEKFQVTVVAGRQYDPLRAGILAAPVMHGREHLFAVVLTLKAGLNAKQR